MEKVNEGIIVPENIKQDDTEKRLKEFQEEYKKLVEKYQIDITAVVNPGIRLIDLKNQK